MNILIIPSWYETDTNKIRGSFFKEQALALSKAGHTVSIGYVYMRTMREMFSKKIYRISKKSYNGVTEYIYSVPSYGSIRRGTWFSRNKKFYDILLRKILSERTYDVIHIHSFIPAGYAVSSLKNKICLPIVYTEHFSQVLKESLPEEKRKALAETMNNSDVLLAVSGALKSAMKKQTKKNIDVLPNILSPLFTYHNENKKTCSNFKFISVGGLIKGKRHDRTITAFHEAFEANEKVELNIIGEGTEREELQKLIDKLGENERIKLVGRKSRDETADLMRQSDAFVLSSAAETFGVAYIEAMASGLPAIGTHNGGFDEIWFEGCGEIIPVDDHEELVRAYKKIYANILNYDRKKISDICISRYGEDRIVSLLEKVYAEAIEKYEYNRSNS